MQFRFTFRTHQELRVKNLAPIRFGDSVYRFVRDEDQDFPSTVLVTLPATFIEAETANNGEELSTRAILTRVKRELRLIRRLLALYGICAFDPLMYEIDWQVQWDDAALPVSGRLGKDSAPALQDAA